MSLICRKRTVPDSYEGVFPSCTHQAESDHLYHAPQLLIVYEIPPPLTPIISHSVSLTLADPKLSRI